MYKVTNAINCSAFQDGSSCIYEIQIHRHMNEITNEVGTKFVDICGT